MYASGCWNKKPNDEIVKLLLERNADIDAKCKHGSTALMYASGCSNSAMTVELLLSHQSVGVKHNVNVNVKNKYGETALMSASRVYDNLCTGTSLLPCVKVLKLLLEYDAIPNDKNPVLVNNIKILNAKN